LRFGFGRGFLGVRDRSDLILGQLGLLHKDHSVLVPDEEARRVFLLQLDVFVSHIAHRECGGVLRHGWRQHQESCDGQASHVYLRQIPASKLPTRKYLRVGAQEPGVEPKKFISWSKSRAPNNSPAGLHTSEKCLIADLGIAGQESQTRELTGPTVGKPARKGNVLFRNRPAFLGKDDRRVTSDQISEFPKSHGSTQAGSSKSSVTSSQP